MKKKRIIAAGAICAALAICLTVLFASGVLDAKPSAVLDHPSRSEITVKAEKDLSLVPEDIAKAYQEAKDVNDDTKGWIYIPDTPINHPVVQGDDNDFYLRRSLTTEYDFEGVLFFDYMDNVSEGFEKFTRNTIIFGHNTTTSGIGTSMFASLLHYDDPQYAQAHPYIYLVTDEGQSVWEIFAGFHTDIGFYYIENNPDDETFASIIETAKRRSTNVYEITPGNDDKILTLSTCAYKYRTASQGDERFVIMARHIDNPTSADIKPVTVTPNENLEEPVFD